MTVNTTSITSGPYNGNGSTTNFAYGFRVEADTQLDVYLTPVGGSPTLQTLTTHYTVTGVSNDSGGDVVMVTPPASGETLYIRSDYPVTQLTSFTSQGAFFPAIHEAAFDELTFIAQQLEDKFSRSLAFDVNYSGGASATLPEPVANRYLAWNSSANAIEYTSSSADLSAPGEIGATTPGIGNFSSVLTDTVSEATAAAGVTVDGVLLKDGALGTANSVVTSNITDEAVTLPKLAHLAQSTIMGRASGAGTGDVTALTAAQGRTLLNVEDGADVTDATNVIAALNGATITQTTTVATNDKILLQDTSDSNNLKYGEPTLIGGKVLLQTVTISSSTADAQLGDGGEMDGTYRRYLIEYDNYEPVTDGAGLRMRFSTDGGSTYLSTNIYHWGYDAYDGALLNNGKSTGTSYAHVLNTAGNVTNDEGADGEILIFNPAATRHTRWSAKNIAVNGAGVPNFERAGGVTKTTSAVDAVQLFPGSGNISKITVKLFGIP